MPRNLIRPLQAFVAAILLLATNTVSANSDYPDDDELENDHSGSYDYLPPVEIVTVDDFASLGKLASDTGSIILLEMSASYCGYCDLLEEEVLKPMLRSGDYVNKVLIRNIKIDSNRVIRDFDGTQTTPAAFSSRYKIFVTPTLLILGDRGKEIVERVIGVQSLDFYAGHLDQALSEGLQTRGKQL